ncbi:MAG: MIP/aquaporin family protein [Gemmatimonadales bacterium]
MKLNWVEYGLEAFGLGLFMLSASLFGVLLFHPASPVVAAIAEPLPRGALMGLAMGLTAMVNTYSPWGRRSGAHLNPAVTLTFHSLGKVSRVDLVGYLAGQFLGGAVGIQVAILVLGPWLGHPAVNYVATVPGPAGVAVAFLAEALITFVLMTVVLAFVAHPRLAPYTGAAAAGLVALYITFEAPFSGMSMNPARTLASAVPAMSWSPLWIYFTAPPLGMLAAAVARRRHAGRHCAKLHHDHRYRCIFCERSHSS